jgi:23S rRNA (uracil1939-C5)-methyltransferase
VGAQRNEIEDKMEQNRKQKNNNVCPYAKKCGGCDYQGKEYREQLAEKQHYVKKLMEPYCKVAPIVGMDDPLHYRHKVHAVFDCTKKGQIVAGVYQKNSHDVVDVESCMIEDEEADAIIRDIKGLLRSFKIKTYDEDTGYGLLRHVLIRKGFHTGQIMVVLVLGSPILPSKNNFVKALRKNHPDISTVVVNVNNKKTSMVLGDRNIVVYGKGYIEDKLCGCTFRISPNSFYQVNPKQTELLYEKAIACAGLTGKERVIDAYCGTGTIGIIASKYAKEVIGVEQNRDAVKDAVTNAKRNEIKNIRFYCEDAGQFMVDMAAKKEQMDVVILDPPRTGSTEEFLSSVVTLSPEKIVYVSCGPDTLARDVKFLTKHGYRAVECTPFDCFPMTKHVETIVKLSQRKPDDVVEVDLDLDELDITSAETKATYNEIKQYVLEQTGLRVTNLYIAQVKQKCGIIERENYNKPKSENSKQPKCTPEKEVAILDALKHFNMI